MNTSFFSNNRKNISKNMKTGSALIMSSGKAPHKSADEYYDYVPNADFYYLTGIDSENIKLIIVKDGEGLEEHLYVEKSDPVMEKWVGKKLSPDEAGQKSGIYDVAYDDQFDAKLDDLIKNGMETVYMDFEPIDTTFDVKFSNYLSDKLKNSYPSIHIDNIHDGIANLRTIKSDEEIECIKKAIHYTDLGIQNMMQNARPGMMEYQIEAYFDFSLKISGIKEYAFNTIAASGVNGTVLHYSANNSKTGSNDLILFDLGAKYGHYSADISRTFPVNGKFTDKQKEIYDIVLEAQRETMESVKPGIPYRSLNNVTRQVLADGLKDMGFIKNRDEISEYYFHGVSHYLGLDTHDVGDYDTLKAGMVLTMEPGLYMTQDKIGIRIEDDILVTDNGYVNLSKDIIKTTDEIEKFMSQNKSR